MAAETLNGVGVSVQVTEQRLGKEALEFSSVQSARVLSGRPKWMCRLFCGTLNYTGLHMAK